MCETGEEFDLTIFQIYIWYEGKKDFGVCALRHSWQNVPSWKYQLSPNDNNKTR